MVMTKQSTGYVVQILMQVSPMNNQPNAGKYSSAWDALKRIPQREGWMVSIPAVCVTIPNQVDTASHFRIKP